MKLYGSFFFFSCRSQRGNFATIHIAAAVKKMKKKWEKNEKKGKRSKKQTKKKKKDEQLHLVFNVWLSASIFSCFWCISDL